MTDFTVGRAARAIRLRLGLRQEDVARRADVSQQLVSRIERGRIAGVATGTLRRVVAALDADLVVTVRWRGGALDRLLDEGHAAIVQRVAAMLRESGWTVIAEATYSIYGERGSVDLLAWDPVTRTVLIVEVKTEIASAEEMLRRHDEKTRLAARLAEERFGEAPLEIGRLLVLEDSDRNRRRAARLDDLLGRTYPVRGPALRRWLKAPAGSIGGLLFASAGTAIGRAGRIRVRRRIRRAGQG